MENVENHENQEESSVITYTSIGSCGTESQSWEAQSKEVEPNGPDQAEHKPSLSPTSVTNVMRSATPIGNTISADAKKMMYECAMKFVDVVFGEAKEQCEWGHCNKLTGDHFVQAMQNLGLYDYVGFFTVFLEHYRKELKDNSGIAVANPRTNEPLPIHRESRGTNPSRLHSSLSYPGGNGGLRLPIPSQCLIPPAQMQGPSASLVDLGRPVPFQPYADNSPLVLRMDNPRPSLLPGKEAAVPLHMQLPGATRANSVPFKPYAKYTPLRGMLTQNQRSLFRHLVMNHRPTPEQVRRLIMHGGGDGASTSQKEEAPPN